MLKRLTMVLLLCGAAFRADATDYTDVWWNTAESGWGANFVQSDKFIFASFFVYGPAGTPTWYSGQLTLGAGGAFTGPLYATTGSYFGAGSFNPAQTTLTPVGTVTFMPTAADAGVLTYNVGNVTITKSIQRLSLTAPPLSGSYSGGVVVETSGCPDPTDNDSLDVPADVTVTQANPGQIKVTLDLLLGIATCSFSSTRRREAGRSARSRFPRATPAEVSRARQRCTNSKSTSLGIEGRWMATDSDGCREEGRFSAVKK